MPRMSSDADLPPPAPDRPRVAVLAYAPTPYQLHLARRLSAEIPEAEFCFLYTDEPPDQGWSLSIPAGINAVEFRGGKPLSGTGRLSEQPRFFRRGGQIIRWMRDNRAAALVCYGYNDAGRLRIARWCRRRRVPFFLAADSNALLDNPRGVRRLLKRAVVSSFLRCASGVMVFGRPGAAYFAHYGMPEERAYFVPYEPDYDALAPRDPAQDRAVRESRGLTAGRRRLLFVGRLLALKRIDLLLAAFVAIADRRPDWDLVLVGDGPLRAELVAAVPPALTSRVIWLGFEGDPAALGSIYRACDVLVLPSEYEAWGLVVNEALANRLAVVTSHVVGAAAHLVRTGLPTEGANGRTFKSGEHRSLAAALLEVTEPGLVDAYKANSPGILAEYRALADPVAGMRKALASVGVLHGR
ncbi:MAG: glycosyltransferase family 4 protein [Phycisphaeraceae bacterium]|nr:glycosyltransferase family 4 protein [Phycisphaeraceae bacterium]